MILQGRVTINGQVTRELGTKVDPHRAHIALDGQTIRLERLVYFAVHKPKGYVSTNHDPAGKPRVVDLLPEIPQRVYTVGRLDEQSTGLLLLTNDGELANKLAHPRFGVEKVYRVVVAGDPAREVLDQLTQGIWLAEGKVRAKRVRVVGHKGQASVMEMVLAEGKNREIRRMLARMGHKVMSLTRIAVGPIGLKGLAVGHARPLSGQEVELLRQVAAGIFVPTPRGPDRRPRKPRPGGAHRTVSETHGAGAAAPRVGAAGGRPQGHPSLPPRPSGPRPEGPPRRRVQASRPTAGPPRRPAGPPPSARPKPVEKSDSAPGPGEGPPARRIIGMDVGPGPRRAGPPRPRPRRPVPKRSPRAALDVKRPPKAGDDAT